MPNTSANIAKIDNSIDDAGERIAIAAGHCSVRKSSLSIGPQSSSSQWHVEASVHADSVSATAHLWNRTARFDPGSSSYPKEFNFATVGKQKSSNMAQSPVHAVSARSQHAVIAA